MPTFRVRVVREEGPEPVTGEHIERAEEVVEIEGDSQWRAAQRSWSKMEMNPHGRLLRYFDAETGKEILPPEDNRPYRRSAFEIDTVTKAYEGYTRGETWNGWAVPFFEFEVAKQIIEDAVRVNHLLGGDAAEAKGDYDEGEDAFTFCDGINDWEEDYYSTLIEVDGEEVKVYPIGTREWTWSELKQERR